MSGPNSKIVSVDPGLAKVALAIWNRNTFELERACLVQHSHEVGTERVQKWRDMAYWVNVEVGDLGEVDLVMEVPQIYGGPRAEDPNDLLDLAGVLGAIASSFAIAEVQWSPLPREWKGQLPKEITQKRVDAKLSPMEKAKIQWPIKSLAHNVYDAIHLGIVYLEREGLREFVK